MSQNTFSTRLVSVPSSYPLEKNGNETPFSPPFPPVAIPAASQDLALDSFHPDALEKIGSLEGKPARAEAEEEAAAAAAAVPTFDTHLQNLQCREGDAALLECSVSPVSDPNLKIGIEIGFPHVIYFFCNTLSFLKKSGS